MTETHLVRLGIIGCGLAANGLHWPALRTLRSRFVVTAVCNRTPEKARRFAGVVGDEYGRTIPYVLDYRELLRRSDVDAVSILLPIELNATACRDAVAAGKHVLLEKPLAANLDEGARLLELETRHPELVMMVAENFRYRAVFAALADAVRSGAIGEPYHVECRSWQRMDPATNPYARTQWRIDHAYEGGYVTDGGVHHVAALRDLVGELDILASVTRSIDPRIGRTDSLIALFRSAGRAGVPPLSGLLDIGYSVTGLEGDRWTILGSTGSAVVEGSTLTLYGQEPDVGPTVQEHPDDGGYAAEYQDFHAAITTGRPPASTFAEAYGDLETVLTALERGARQGAWGPQSDAASGPASRALGDALEPT